MKTRTLPPLVPLALALAASAGLAGCGDRADAPRPELTTAAGEAPADESSAQARPSAAGFVDEAACAGCHAQQQRAWVDSHHDLAMQTATPETVLGDFADARFQDDSTDTRFERDGEHFKVTTEGPDGERGTFVVPLVFGIEPLQQVLLELPRGRLQALSVAWDTQAERWFSLSPDERIDAADELHWTRPPYNWNFSCAECHATDLRRNYDPQSDTYATTWHRPDVGCQACHGPAAEHLAWAMGGGPATEGHGFGAPLKGPDSHAEIEACARCHARRAPLGDGFDHRNRLLDDYLPALLEEGLYHADGQIQDEVYVYGSFLQSKMHTRGVRCSDCHEPHSLGLVASGNALCTRCHSPTPQAREHVDLSTIQRKNYDSSEHHHHAPGSAGARCVDCHMPETTYMQVDPRRDHGFHVPRPDLAASTASPDACTGCHEERDAAWAAETIEGWYGPRKRPTHFGVALRAGRDGRPGAADGLLSLAHSEETAIVRATALRELTRYPSRKALETFQHGLGDSDGLVRLAALGGLELLPPAERVPAAGPLLDDPLRAVRSEAARLLIGLPPPALGPFAPAAENALAEYETIQRDLLERAEARLNLAHLLQVRGQGAEAEELLRGALRLDPLSVPAHVNLADVVRARSEAEAETLLRTALRTLPNAAALHHSLGLTLVRQGRVDEALPALESAAALGPDDPRYGYVLAIALQGLERPAAARAALERVLARHPGSRDARFALAEYLQASGDEQGARDCLDALRAVNPHDPGLEAAPTRPGR